MAKKKAATKPTKLETNAGPEKPGPVEEKKEEQPATGNPRVVEDEAEANYRCNREDCNAFVHWDPPADYPAGQPPFLKCPKCGKTNVLFRRKAKGEKKEDPDEHPIELHTSAPEVELKEMELAEQGVAEQQLEKTRAETTEFYKNTPMEKVMARAFITRMDPKKLIVVPEWKALVSRLKPKDQQELYTSLDAHGMLDPIKTLISGKIIDGFTRQEYAITRGLHDVPVMSLDIPEEEARIWVRRFNVHRRQMTIGEKAFQAVELLKDERELAKIRQEKARQIGLSHARASKTASSPEQPTGTNPTVDESGKSPAASTDGAPSTPTQTPPSIPEEEKGNALDKVAKATGLSHTTVSNAETVQKAAEAGDTDAREDIEKVKAGTMSVSAAAKKVREKRKVHAAKVTDTFLDVVSLNKVIQQSAGKISEWSNRYQIRLNKEEKVTLAKCGDMLQDISKEIFPIEKRLKEIKVPPTKKLCQGCGNAFDPKELMQDDDGDYWCQKCADDPCAGCMDEPDDCPECESMKGFKFRKQCIECQNCESETCPNPDWDCPSCESCSEEDLAECSDDSEEEKPGDDSGEDEETEET